MRRYARRARQSALPSLKACRMASASLSPLAASALVAGGGALGALARFHSGRLLTDAIGAPAADAFPWSTLAVNLVGSLLMGGLVGWLARGSLSTQTAESMRLLIGVGLLGGFTTFSAFSAEMVTLVHRGAALQALGYGATSLMAGMAAIILGLVAAQSVS